MIKNLIKNTPPLHRIYLNIKNYFSTKKKLKESIGQIRDAEVKNKLYEIIKNEKIENIVEIGTWNGLGSTKMIIDLIKKSNQQISFYSVESDSLCFKAAKKNLKADLDYVNLILGRVYEVEELNYITKELIFEFGYGDKQYEWFIQDMRRYKKIKNIKPLLPQSIDILFLDGGEYSGYADFLNLHERSKYIFLDDTLSIKQHNVLEFINSNANDFDLIFNSNKRGGMQIYKSLKII